MTPQKKKSPINIPVLIGVLLVIAAVCGIGYAFYINNGGDDGAGGNYTSPYDSQITTTENPVEATTANSMVVVNEDGTTTTYDLDTSTQGVVQIALTDASLESIASATIDGTAVSFREGTVLDEGSHELEITAEGYATHSSTETIKAGGNEIWTVDLLTEEEAIGDTDASQVKEETTSEETTEEPTENEPILGSYRIGATYTGTKIFFDNEFVGVTPLEGECAPGVYTVTAIPPDDKMDEYSYDARQAEIFAGYTYVMSFSAKAGASVEEPTSEEPTDETPTDPESPEETEFDLTLNFNVDGVTIDSSSSYVSRTVVTDDDITIHNIPKGTSLSITCSKSGYTTKTESISYMFKDTARTIVLESVDDDTPEEDLSTIPTGYIPARCYLTTSYYDSTGHTLRLSGADITISTTDSNKLWDNINNKFVSSVTVKTDTYGRTPIYIYGKSGGKVKYEFKGSADGFANSQTATVGTSVTALKVIPNYITLDLDVEYHEYEGGTWYPIVKEDMIEDVVSVADVDAYSGGDSNWRLTLACIKKSLNYDTKISYATTSSSIYAESLSYKSIAYQSMDELGSKKRLSPIPVDIKKTPYVVIRVEYRDEPSLTEYHQIHITTSGTTIYTEEKLILETDGDGF